MLKRSKTHEAEANNEKERSVLVINYESEFLSRACQTEEVFQKEFPFVAFNQYKKAILQLTISKKISDAQKNRGLNIEKLKSLEPTGSFRLNKKSRVNFNYDGSMDFLEVSEITIERIHPHKY